MKLEKNKAYQAIKNILIDPTNFTKLKKSGSFFKSSESSFPIVDGIPRFVSSDNYVNSFSLEWNTHNNTQLDSKNNTNDSEDQFIKKTGFRKKNLKSKLVLDAGVGAGRYADVIKDWGCNIVGVDLSYAVNAAYNNFKEVDNILIMQADIGNLPFKESSFDVIYSIGVLHHTPNTKDYFMNLVKLLKPGGKISIWVYPNNESYKQRKAWVKFINLIPSSAFYSWCRWYVPFVHKIKQTPFGGWLYRFFPISDQNLGLENDILDTFDGTSPKYHWIHSTEEVIGWFKEADLKNIKIPSSWETCVTGDK